MDSALVSRHQNRLGDRRGLDQRAQEWRTGVRLLEVLVVSLVCLRAGSVGRGEGYRSRLRRLDRQKLDQRPDRRRLTFPLQDRSYHSYLNTYSPSLHIHSLPAQSSATSLSKPNCPRFPSYPLPPTCLMPAHLATSDRWQRCERA